MKRRDALQALSCAAALPGVALAVPGDAKDTFRIGQSVPLTGPGAAQSKSYVAGLGLSLDSVNRSGGVSGRPLQLVTLDDGLQPARTLENLKTLLKEHEISLLTGVAGTENVLAIEDLLRSSGVPLLGAVAVSDQARTRTAGAVYYIRASYRREAERIIEQIATQGLTSVGIAFSDTPGGHELRKAQEELFAKRGIKVKVTTGLKRDGSGIDEAATALAAARPDAVLLNAPGGVPARLIGAMNRLGASPAYFGMSLVAAETTAQALGTRLRSLVISQVMPYPWSRTLPLVEEFRRRAGAANAPVDYSAMEGYVTGLVLADVLRRAGPVVSPAKLHAAIRATRGSFCGVDVNFGGSNNGSRYVDLIHIDGAGRIAR